MNKQKVFAISVIALIAALSVGGTSAYFAASIRSHNVITMSGISIELIEDTNVVGVDGRALPFTNVSGAMPGDQISKIPKVKNVDDGDAYVRMQAVAHVTLKDGTTEDLAADVFNLDINTADWTAKDGYYYYDAVLRKNETTSALFTTVTIPNSLPDNYQGATFALDVHAEAVQVANNGATALEAQGWPEE